MPEHKFRILLDSGAYSAWRLGKPVSLPDYIAFALEHRECFNAIVALDKIDPDNPVSAAAVGWRNFQRMRDVGLDPLPVIHWRENLDWLGHYLDAGCRYIGISASALPPGSSEADQWYEQAWQRLRDSAGNPIVKVHAFGVGRERTLTRFPFYSADTTTWLHTSQRGGKARWVERMRRLGRIAADSSSDLMDSALRSPNHKVQYVARTAIDCMESLAMEGRVQEKRPDFRLHLVIGDNVSARAALAFAGGRNALASYFHIRGQSIVDELTEFVHDYDAACRNDIRFANWMDRLGLATGASAD